MTHSSAAARRLPATPTPTPSPAQVTRRPSRRPSPAAPDVSWWDASSRSSAWAPIVFMGLIVFFLWRTMKLMPQDQAAGDQARRRIGSIEWDEVAGADEAKAELQEVVDFLRDPQRFRELGAKVPKGILLHGPPGTGKTLLAKAVANESGAQFFAQSAAAFVEMFAGLGAARIRRLFARGAQARRRRSSSSTRSTPSAAERGSDNNSEREQTLNQLLVEMDGFALRPATSSSSPRRTCSRSSTRRCCAPAASTARSSSRRPTSPAARRS